jgi:phosphoesterase RecJ-like protein
MTSNMIQNNKLCFTSQTPPVNEITEAIKSAKRVLVASHIDPDGDSLGTQLAVAEYLKDLGKDVILMRDSEIPVKYTFLSNIEKIPNSDSFDKELQFDTAIILECPNITRIGKASGFINDNVNIINIDHHQDNNIFGQLNWINNTASSVGEMVYEYFKSIDYKISPNVAECLYVAILTDTGRFRYRSTSPRTLVIAGELIEAGADPQVICDNVYYNMKPSSMILIGKVLNGIKFYHDNKICLLELSNKMLEEAGAHRSESDGMVDFTLFNRGVIAGALIKEIDTNKYKVSLRSKNGINVAAIAAEYGGGGHFNAAGCSINLSLEETREAIIKKLSEAIDAQNR